MTVKLSEAKVKLFEHVCDGAMSSFGLSLCC